MKRSTLLILIFLFIFQIVTYANINDIQYHWAFEDINRCIENEYINGYEDNSFKPNNYIKYNEFIKILVEMLDNGICNDISKWDETYIAYAIEVNLIEENNKYNYDDFIQREDAFKLIYKYIQLNFEDMVIEDKVRECQLIDIDNNDNEILFLYNNYIISGYLDNTLKLSNNITRAEVTVLLNKTTDYIYKTIYSNEIRKDIFYSESISHFTNYKIEENNFYEKDYLIKDGKILFFEKKKVDEIIENEKVNVILCNLFNKGNYVLNTYDKEEKCVNIIYGDTLGYILNQDKILEINIYHEVQKKREYNYKVRITVYRLWKEIYEVKNNMQNQYYVEKLKNVLGVYLNEDEVNGVLQYIKEKKEIKNENYIIENNNIYLK